MLQANQSLLQLLDNVQNGNKTIKEKNADADTSWTARQSDVLELNSLSRISKLLFLKVKLKMSAKEMLKIPHCTGQLCAHHYSMYCLRMLKHDSALSYCQHDTNSNTHQVQLQGAASLHYAKTSVGCLLNCTLIWVC